DVTDAEREDEAVEADLAASVDRRHEVGDQLALVLRFALLRGRSSVLAGGLCALLAELASALLEHAVDLFGALREAKDVRRILEQAFLVQRLEVGGAEALDVERVARHEMLEALDG